jgi:hypothetical protein
MLLERTASQTGREFLRSLVHNLCRALDTKGSWVTEYLTDRRRLRSLAFWFGDNWVDSYEYDVDGTPCKPVIDTCRLIHIPDRVVELFPGDPDLASLEASATSAFRCRMPTARSSVISPSSTASPCRRIRGS